MKVICFLFIILSFKSSDSRSNPTLSTIFGALSVLKGNYTDETVSMTSSGRSSGLYSKDVGWPQLMCGPIRDLKAKRVLLQESSKLPIEAFHIVFVRKSTDTGCILTESSLSLLTENTESSSPSSSESDWVYLTIPPYLKIEESATSYIQDVWQTYSARSTSSSDSGGRIQATQSSSNTLSRDNFVSTEDAFILNDVGEVEEAVSASTSTIDAKVHILTIEFTPSALQRQLSSVWAEEYLSASTVTDFLDSSPLRDYLLSNLHKQSEERIRKLRESDCTLPSSSEVTTGPRTMHIIGLGGLSEVCLAELLNRAAFSPYVLRILLERKPTVYNIEASALVSSGSMSEEPFKAAGLRGRGQVVAVADTGLDDRSCFFFDNSQKYATASTDRTGVVESGRRKVVQYVGYADSTDDLGGHGTHVAGTVAGASVDAYAAMDGVAPEAKISFFDIGKNGAQYLDVPVLYTDVFPKAYESGARIHTNSWGGTRRQYGYQSFDIDGFTVDNPDMLILFAAGNSGANGLKSVGSPSNAKNCISVGAMETRDTDDDQFLPKSAVAWYSSMGPTYDGRIKPDLVAPGSQLMSAHCGYDGSIGLPTDGMNCGAAAKMGTSMATPVVAGIAALLRQYFMDSAFWEKSCNPAYKTCQLGAFTPSGYLLKALLLHSCQGVHQYSTTDFDFKTKIKSFQLGIAPDMIQGYGGVNLQNILPLRNGNGLDPRLDLVLWDRVEISEYSTLLWNVTVNSTSAMQLKITICWYDPPAFLGYVSSLLLHDLDLLVLSPSGDVYWGNGDYGSSSGGDERNPNEQVVIDVPSCLLENCIYNVYVRANSLLEAEVQTFAMVITANGLVTGPEPADFPQSYDVKVESVDSAELDTMAEVPDNIIWTQGQSDRNNNGNGNKQGNSKNQKDTSSGSTNTDTSTATTATTTSPAKESPVDRFPVDIPVMALSVRAMNRSTDFEWFLHNKVLVGTFNYTGNLLAVDISLRVSRFMNMSATSAPLNGLYAFILALVVTDPKGYTLQIGGSDWFATNDKFCFREWPRTWAQYKYGPTTFTASRNLESAGLFGSGIWKVEAAIGLDAAVRQTFYAGNMSFVYSAAATSMCSVPVSIGDSFGDGWDGITLVATGGGMASPQYFQPWSNGLRVVHVQITSGHSVTLQALAKNSSLLRPMGYWEMYWSVEFGSSLHIGGFESMMVLRCLSEAAGYEYLQSNEDVEAEDGLSHKFKADVGWAGNLKSALLHCSECAVVESNVMSIHLSSGSDSTHSYIAEAERNASSGADISLLQSSTQRHAPSDYQLKNLAWIQAATRYSLDMVFYFPDNAYSILQTLEQATSPLPYFSVSHTDQNVLVVYGTICPSEAAMHSKTLHCLEALPDGPYLFRVNGDLQSDSFKANSTQLWSFCGLQGSYGDQLAFTISNSRCIPGVLASVAQLTTSAGVRIQVELQVDDLLLTEMTDSAANVLTTNSLATFSDTVTAVLASYDPKIDISSYSITNSSLTKKSCNVHILVTIVICPDRIRVGTSSSMSRDLEELAYSVEHELSTAAVSGIFKSTLQENIASHHSNITLFQDTGIFISQFKMVSATIGSDAVRTPSADVRDDISDGHTYDLKHPISLISHLLTELSSMTIILVLTLCSVVAALLSIATSTKVRLNFEQDIEMRIFNPAISAPDLHSSKEMTPSSSYHDVY